MKASAYHNNLSNWMRNYMIDLTKDIDEKIFWKRAENTNCPGWILMHLIAEAEFAILKLDEKYDCKIKNANDFLFGSDGNATTDLSINQILEMFSLAYNNLSELVNNNLEQLSKSKIKDEDLKFVLKTELDYFLHILTTHLAMHCNSLVKWRKLSGLKSPY